MNSSGHTRASMGDWLRGRVVTYGELAPDSFSDDTPLADLGFTSVYALTLCGDIEDTFGLVVEPTIVWDNPTIRELAIALEGLLQESSGGGDAAEPETSGDDATAPGHPAVRR